MPHPKDDIFLNLFTDFGFKKVFGEIPNKHLLISFLNTLLPEKHQIADLEYTRNEYTGRSESDRRAVIDISCTASSGERFIIELQKARQNFFKDRSVYYSTFPIAEQAKQGDWNFKLAHVYTVGILNFNFDDELDNNDVIHSVRLKNDHNKVFYDKLTYIYLTLPRFTKTVHELTSFQDKWFFLLKHLHELNHVPGSFNEQAFVDLFKIAEVAKLNAAEYTAYEESVKVLRDLSNVIDTAWQDGNAKGIDQGIEQGIEKGIELTARNMLKEGASTEFIAKVTGLSIEQLRALSQKF
jgi:predicted transposase/invertase (TIGR01784 family)